MILVGGVADCGRALPFGDRLCQPPAAASTASCDCRRSSSGERRRAHDGTVRRRREISARSRRSERARSNRVGNGVDVGFCADAPGVIGGGGGISDGGRSQHDEGAAAICACSEGEFGARRWTVIASRTGRGGIASGPGRRPAKPVRTARMNRATSPRRAGREAARPTGGEFPPSSAATVSASRVDAGRSAIRRRITAATASGHRRCQRGGCQTETPVVVESPASSAM